MSRPVSILLAGALVALPAGAEAQQWSGFYVGADAGIAEARLRASSTDDVLQLTNINPAGPQPFTVVPGTTAALARSDRETAFSYGAILGFLAQSGGWAYGLEADLQGPRELSSTAQTTTLPATLLSPASTLVQRREADTRYSWSLRARLGAVVGRTFLYGAAGVAGARVEVDAVNSYTIPAGTSASGVAGPAIGPNVTTASERRTMTGWTAGGGVEQMLGRFVVGLDARYTDHGDRTFTFANVAIARSGATAFPGAENNSGQIGPPNNDPRADPGPTRVGLAEWRVAARVLLRF